MAKQIIINRKQTVKDKWTDSYTGVESVTKPVKKDSFLDECAGYAEDEWWRNILLRMSVGRYPDGVKYHNGTLLFESNKLALNIDPEVACDEIITFLQMYAHLRSPNDPEEEEVEEVKNTSGQLWSTMLKKHKEQAVIRFLLNEQKDKKLNHAECDRLRYILNIGFILKYFHKDNVIVNNYTIVSIDALMYDESTRTYTIDKTQKRKESRSTTRSNTKPKKNYNDVWLKICSTIDNKVADNDEDNDEDHSEEYSRSST